MVMGLTAESVACAAHRGGIRRFRAEASQVGQECRAIKRELCWLDQGKFVSDVGIVKGLEIVGDGTIRVAKNVVSG